MPYQKYTEREFILSPRIARCVQWFNREGQQGCDGMTCSYPLYVALFTPWHEIFSIIKVNTQFIRRDMSIKLDEFVISYRSNSRSDLCGESMIAI